MVAVKCKCSNSRTALPVLDTKCGSSVTLWYKFSFCQCGKLFLCLCLELPCCMCLCLQPFCCCICLPVLLPLTSPFSAALLQTSVQSYSRSLNHSSPRVNYALGNISSTAVSSWKLILIFHIFAHRCYKCPPWKFISYLYMPHEPLFHQGFLFSFRNTFWFCVFLVPLLL